MRIILNKNENEVVELEDVEFLSKDSEKAKFSDIYSISVDNTEYILKCPKISTENGAETWGDDVWKALYDSEFAGLNKIESDHIAKPVYMCYNIEVYEEEKISKSYACGLLQQYVKGSSLESRKNNEINRKTACGLSIQIIDAVKMINTNGLYHLDIHDNNIKVSKENNSEYAVLIDFTGGFNPNKKTKLIMSETVKGKLSKIQDLTKDHCIRAQAYMVFKIFNAICTIDEDMERRYESFDPENGPMLDELRETIEKFMNN